MLTYLFPTYRFHIVLVHVINATVAPRVTPDPINVTIRNVWGAEGLPGVPDGPGQDVCIAVDRAAVPTGSWEEVVFMFFRPMPII